MRNRILGVAIIMLLGSMGLGAQATTSDLDQQPLGIRVISGSARIVPAEPAADGTERFWEVVTVERDGWTPPASEAPPMPTREGVPPTLSNEVWIFHGPVFFAPRFSSPADVSRPRDFPLMA